MKLLLATANPHKLREFRRLMPDFVLTSLADYPPNPEPVVECADDYAGNAIIKALAAHRSTAQIAFADDSGIEVAALGWGPGLRSARYVEGSDTARRRALFDAVGGADDRRARYVCAIALCGLPGALECAHAGRREDCFVVHGVVTGHIGDAERGTGGFGYDPIFVPDGAHLTMAELTDAEKDRISHRGIAARELVKLLRA